MRRHTLFLPAVVAGLLLLATVASAEMIPNAISGVTATGHHQGDSPNGDGSIRTAVDGTGLTVGDPADPATWTHSTRWQDDWQGTYVTSPTEGWMVLDLGSVVTMLDTMYIWNVNENAGGGQSHTDRGAATLNVYYSNNPTVTPPTVSTATQTYDFSSGGWTQLGSTVSIPEGGTNISQTVDVSAIPSAQYIGLDFLTRHGTSTPLRVGVAEVQITTVPEPSTLALVALGLLSLAFYGRRRKP